MNTYIVQTQETYYKWWRVEAKNRDDARHVFLSDRSKVQELSDDWGDDPEIVDICEESESERKESDTKKLYLVVKSIEVEHVFVRAENKEQAEKRAYEVEDICLNGVEPGQEGLRDGEECELLQGELEGESEFVSGIHEQENVNDLYDKEAI